MDATSFSARKILPTSHSALNDAGELEDARDSKAYNAAILIVFALILIPIWVVNYPGMEDYPNHLVRCYILAHYHDNPLWQQRYWVDRNPLPNLAIDAIVTPLTRFLPLILCGKIFLSLAAALFVFGCSELGRALIGRPNWLALVGSLAFYNIQLLMGFVNFIFGIGVFLCAFAFWYRYRNRLAPWSFIVCCLLSLVAFLAHLSSVVFLGVACLMIALFDFARDRKLPALFCKLAWLACPALLFVVFMKGSGRIGSLDWATAWLSLWHWPMARLFALASPIRTHERSLSFGLALILLIALLAMLRGARIHRVAWVGLVFWTLYVLMPDTMFTALHVGERFIVPGYLLLVLSIEPRWDRWQKAAFGVALTAMLIHTGNVFVGWLSINRESEQVLAMDRVLPENARVFVVDQSSNERHAFAHIIQFWTLSREANVSNFFGLPGQQPLVFRQPACHGPTPFEPWNDPEWRSCLATSDFVYTFDENPPAIRQLLASIATPAASVGEVTLWRVNRTGETRQGGR